MMTNSSMLMFASCIEQVGLTWRLSETVSLVISNGVYIHASPLTATD